MVSHLRVKMATGLPGAESSGQEVEGMGQVEGFGNGQVDATIRVILRAAEHEMIEGALPLQCKTLLSSRIGPWPYA
jgi:hypothetical protein